MAEQFILDSNEIKAVSLIDEKLSINKIIAVTRYFARIKPLAGSGREKLEAIRRFIERNWFDDSAPPRYGFNTGIGSLKNVKISQRDIEKFQQNYVKSHSVGVGRPLDIEIVRGAMLLQAYSLSKGFSGIRPVVIDKLIEMLNKQIHPVVPEQGSLGTSGDLAPLTHIASVLTGEDEAEIWIGQRKHKLRKLKNSEGVISFKRNGEEIRFQTIQLQGKEAVSLTNATAVMLSVAVHIVHDAETLLKNADIAAALSLEAMMCEKDAFDEALHRLRNQDGQITTAKNIRLLTADSKRMTVEARHSFFRATTKDNLLKKLNNQKYTENDISSILSHKYNHEFEKNRVQDAYSLRCIPQVHGASKDAFRYVKSIIEREIEAVTDNPVVFPDKDNGYLSRSGGNFHGQPLALTMDFLAIAIAEIGSISERRTFRLLSPHMSFGLPRNLAGSEPGLNSGLMMVQYTGAQLVSENKTLCHPASVDNIPTSDNQEDHVSMGLLAARKARQVLKNVETLMAIEYLCSVQGIHLSAGYDSTNLDEFPLGKGTLAAFDFIRNCKHPENDTFPFALMQEDEYLHTKIELMRDLTSKGNVINVVESEFELEI